MARQGLKMMRSKKGTEAPNDYWKRPGRKRCSCGYRIRGANHEDGSHHQKGH